MICIWVIFWGPDPDVNPPSSSKLVRMAIWSFTVKLHLKNDYNLWQIIFNKRSNLWQIYRLLV